MSTDYERTFRAEVLKECLASILPEYNSDFALNQAEKQYQEFKNKYEKLKKGV